MNMTFPNETQENTSLNHWNHFYSAVEHYAEVSPDSAAIYYRDTFMTYRELNQRSNQVASYLKKLQVGPESLVGVIMERTPETVICLLGILKSGGAYLPIDPAHPIDRIAYILEDSKVELILSHLQFINALPQLNAKVICMDQEWASIANERDENVNVHVDPNYLAYVIYTSGSTGKPKGVEITRSAVNNFIHSMSKYPGVTHNDRLLSLTTLSFDISVLELFLPLFAGASVVLAEQENCKDANYLCQLIEAFDITVMQATPATWYMLIETGWQGNKKLKALCGGEAVSRELVNHLVSMCGSVWNMYGPTETTVWSAVAELSYGEGSVPIGRPIDHTTIVILDEHLQPVPPGESGEIHIGGAGVARGYLGRPELTNERFIEYDDQINGYLRIYKTGDLGRILPDGSIECLGRSDFQVKLRGYRIELGEIEAALEQMPTIRQAIVVLKEISPTDKKLIAYYRPEQLDSAATNDLKESIKKVLPDYMIPSYFEPIEAFPLTPNGKVDRKALTELQLSASFAKRVIVPPSTPVEIEVSQVWEKLLKIKDISVHDSFLDLGGHSLLASMMIHQLNLAFNVNLSLMDVFTHGLTIVELASLIEERIVEGASEEDIESLLGMLEGLSDDEIQKLLNKAGN